MIKVRLVRNCDREKATYRIKNQDSPWYIRIFNHGIGISQPIQNFSIALLSLSVVRSAESLMQLEVMESAEVGTQGTFHLQ